MGLEFPLRLTMNVYNAMVPHGLKVLIITPSARVLLTNVQDPLDTR